MLNRINPFLHGRNRTQVKNLVAARLTHLVVGQLNEPDQMGNNFQYLSLKYDMIKFKKDNGGVVPTMLSH